jgi:two-component system, OmpR family, response regulator
LWLNVSEAVLDKTADNKAQQARQGECIAMAMMNAQTHVLIVEDDAEIARGTSRFLAQAGYRVSVAPEARSMDRIMKDARIDLMLLDLMLPGEDGLSICRRLRAHTNVPIIMLTAMGEEMDRVVGLELGADDYLAKPFSTRELLARIRAVLRRGAENGQGDLATRNGKLTFDGWVLDPATRQLHNRDGVKVVMTGAEFELLTALCERPRRVLTRDQLLDLTQGRGGRSVRSLDRHADQPHPPEDRG